MSEPSLHILHPYPGQDGLLAFFHTLTQPRNLCIDHVDLLILIAQFPADFLVGLPIAHVPFIQRLAALKNRFALPARLVRLPAFLFDLIFQLFEGLPFLVDLFVDGISPDIPRHPKSHQKQCRQSQQRCRPHSHTFASSSRRRDTKLPAQPSTMPTATSIRHIERGKNIMSWSSPLKRPVVPICRRNNS